MERMRPHDDHVITQVATVFRRARETIQRVRVVEFKYAQGAKPGSAATAGGQSTPAVARIRKRFSAFSVLYSVHSVYSIEDHKKHMDWIKHVNRHALISTKVSTPINVDMVAVGSYSAGMHIIHLDRRLWRHRRRADIAKKNIAMPIEYAIVKVHRFLVAEGIRKSDLYRQRRICAALMTSPSHRPGR